MSWPLMWKSTHKAILEEIADHVENLDFHTSGDGLSPEDYMEILGSIQTLKEIIATSQTICHNTKTT